MTDAAQLDAAAPAQSERTVAKRLSGGRHHQLRRADRHRLQLEVLRCLRPGHGGSAGRHFQCEEISVPGKQNTPLSAAVQELTRDEDAGLAKLVVSCQTVNAEILSFGVETAQIDLKTYEGIRIDKAALHIVDGQRGVYVKYGNLQRFLKIETLYEDENYILIPDNGKLGTDNEVRLYDEIIVQGTNLQDGKLL